LEIDSYYTTFSLLSFELSLKHLIDFNTQLLNIQPIAQTQSLAKSLATLKPCHPRWTTLPRTPDANHHFHNVMFIAR